MRVFQRVPRPVQWQGCRPDQLPMHMPIAYACVPECSPVFLSQSSSWSSGMEIAPGPIAYAYADAYAYACAYAYASACCLLPASPRVPPAIPNA